jgi:serine protease Do
MKTSLKNMIQRLSVLALGAAVLATLTAATVGAKKEHNRAAQNTVATVAVDERPLTRDARLGTSFAPIVKEVAPSVVKVYTTTKVKETSMRDMPLLNDPFFRRFFGDEFDRPDRQRRFYTPPQHGLGSGVIVTKDGYILTNNHVVDDADQVKVALQDGRDFTAQVIGKDPKSDVAVVRIDAKDLPALRMADSDKIEVGDIVLAVGNPFGIGQTVTMGMVSATGRATLGLDYEDFIQTDAAINPGNSGGALVDTEGRLIGINTAILSRSGGNQGIGFAIPTNLARDIMESLIKDGKVTRGYLGVMIQDVTPALAKEFSLKDDQGALVGDVVPKGPADKAGLKNGDVILEFNGKPVKDSRHLKLEVARAKPGEMVPVKILRENDSKTLKVTLRELPATEKLAKAESTDAEETDALHGVTVTDLSAQARRQFNVPREIQGALVTDVDPGSAAAEAGLKPGDVIIEINRKPVVSAEDAAKLTENAKDKTTLLRVWSGRGSHYVVVDEGKTG